MIHEGPTDSGVLCIYHGQCIDGFTAAWVVSRKFEKVRLHAGVHGEPPPEVRSCDVVMVDFSYPRETMLRMISEANDFICLDHHKTAQANCEGIEQCVFDMTKCGARLAWERFFPNVHAPRIIEYVEDRDLWANKLPHTHEINSYIRSWPYKLMAFTALYEQFQNEALFSEAAKAGAAILRHQDQSIANHVEHARFSSLAEVANEVTVGPTGLEINKVPVVNCTSRSIVSKLGHELCKHFKSPWSLSYRDEGKQRVYTLTSIGEVDVSEIAKRQGGGGHNNAAGFQKPI